MKYLVVRRLPRTDDVLEPGAVLDESEVLAANLRALVSNGSLRPVREQTATPTEAHTAAASLEPEPEPERNPARTSQHHRRRR